VEKEMPWRPIRSRDRVGGPLVMSIFRLGRRLRGRTGVAGGAALVFIPTL
jgi:hypothetical protein